MLRDTWRAAIDKTLSVPQDYKKEVWLVRQHSTAWVTVSATWLWKEKQQSLIFFADPKQGLSHFITGVPAQQTPPKMAMAAEFFKSDHLTKNATHPKNQPW